MRAQLSLLAIVIALAATGKPAPGQDGAPKIVTAYGATIKAIGENKYEAALKLADEIIAEFGDANAGKEAFGPVYGHWFYLRGLANIGLGKWQPASIDFEACYNCTDRSTKIIACKKCVGLGRITSTMNPGARDPDGKMPCTECGGIPYRVNNQPNQFRMHALVQWGNCQMVVEDYAKARDLYQKALSEDRANQLNVNWRRYVAVNMGRCLIKSGKVEEGYQYIIRVLDEPRFDRRLKQIIFQILADDWSPLVGSGETLDFLAKYGHIPRGDSLENRIPRNSNFFLLATDALEKRDPVLALSWFRLVAHPGKVISENDHTIAIYQARKETAQNAETAPLIDAEIAKLQEQQTNMKENLWAMLSGNGLAHFQIKNYAASFAVYRGLSDHAPKTHAGRPDFLHNAVISAAQIDDWQSAYQYGKAFLDEFPTHKLKPSVARVLVEIVFINGNFEEAYDISKQVRADLELGSEARDIPDFVFGASAYQLGKFEEAEAELDAYLKSYSPPQRAELAKYFLASSKVKLLKWQDASALFDPFLKDYPASALTSSVLYQNGLCKFMLDDYEIALPLVNRLLKDYPLAEEIPAGWNLTGDIHTIEEADFDAEVGPAYEKAIATSQLQTGQEEIAAYAQWQLVMNLAELERWEEAAHYFDEFQTHHPYSIYKVEMLIGALETLVQSNRKEEAVTRQESMLLSLTGDPQIGEIGELFGTYLEFLQKHDLENASKRLNDLNLNSISSVALRAWTQIGQIELLDKAEGDHEEAISKRLYMINADFDPPQHSNYVIVKMARWHSETRGKPEDAAPLYDYILENRKGTDDYDLALLDRALIDSESEASEDQERAMTNFGRILSEFENEDLTETASVGVARLLMRNKNYTEALPHWEAYMENARWNQYSAEANYNYALCLDQTGKTPQALVVYINTYNAFPGHVDYSTPAYLRSALIMKEKGEDLKALLILKDMLTRLKNIEHPNKQKALQLFNKWRSEYTPPAKTKSAS